jgi:hypothetical protein
MRIAQTVVLIAAVPQAAKVSYHRILRKKELQYQSLKSEFAGVPALKQEKPGEDEIAAVISPFVTLFWVL